VSEISPRINLQIVAILCLIEIQSPRFLVWPIVICDVAGWWG